MNHGPDRLIAVAEDFVHMLRDAGEQAGQTAPDRPVKVVACGDRVVQISRRSA